MKKQPLLSALSVGLFTIGLANSADAALVTRLEGQAVYDTDLNITWLADANLAASNTFGTSGINPDGTMNWNTANTWVGNMNSANYLGFNDWRLPTTLVPDPSCTTDTAGTTSSGDSTGYNCTGSEMGHLYYTEFGATATDNGTNGLTAGNPVELAKFTNILSQRYWSGTEFSPDTSNAWVFFMSPGSQFYTNKISITFPVFGTIPTDFNVWAVRSGDVGVSAVPVPAAVWLFGSGLLGLLGVAKRKRAHTL